MKKPTTKPPRRETTTSARLTHDEYQQLVQAATREGMSASEFTRQVILSSITGIEEPRTRLQMEFQVVGEERIRLLIAAATKGRDVEAPEIQVEIERQAFLAAPGLTTRRLLTLKQSFVEETDAHHGEGE